MYNSALNIDRVDSMPFKLVKKRRGIIAPKVCSEKHYNEIWVSWSKAEHTGHNLTRSELGRQQNGTEGNQSKWPELGR